MSFLATDSDLPGTGHEKLDVGFTKRLDHGANIIILHIIQRARHQSNHPRGVNALTRQPLQCLSA